MKTRSDGRDHVRRGAEGALYPRNSRVKKREQREKQKSITGYSFKTQFFTQIYMNCFVSS